MKVLIPDVESGHSIWACEGLRKENVELNFISKKKFASLKFFPHKKYFIIKPNLKSSEYIDAILNHADSIKADIILPIGEETGYVISKNIKNFENFATIPLPEPSIFETAINKWKIANFCELNSIPSPKTIWLNDFFSSQFELRNKLPLIVKPVRGDGGKNIKIMYTKSELENFFLSVKDLSMGDYIVQEFVDGFDIDVSVIAVRGKIVAFTIQKGFLKRSNKFAASAGIVFLYNEKLYQTVERLIKRLNFTGISHIDLRYDIHTYEYKVIEMNVRFWGSLMGSINAGVNFPYLACLAGLGLRFPMPEYKHIRYVDILSLLKNPKIYFNEKIYFKETNLAPILSNPIAHSLNIIQRL